MNKEKIINEIEKKLDEQWGVTSHYIVWGDWVKDALRDTLKSQREDIVEEIKDVRDRVFEHRGENKQLDESINSLVGVMFEEIINIITKEDAL